MRSAVPCSTVCAASHVDLNHHPPLSPGVSWPEAGAWLTVGPGGAAGALAVAAVAAVAEVAEVAVLEGEVAEAQPVEAGQEAGEQFSAEAELFACRTTGGG